MLFAGTRQLGSGLRIIERRDEKRGAIGAGGVQQVDPGGIAIKGPKAELATLRYVIGVVIQHHRLHAAGMQQTCHHLTDPTEPGDDHHAGFRHVFLALAGACRQARCQHAVMQHQQKGRGQHRQGHCQRDGARGFAGNRAVALAQAQQHESEFAALRQQQDE